MHVTHTFSAQIPLPAVTICPFLKYQRSVVSVADAMQFLQENKTTGNTTKLWRQIINTLPFFCELKLNENLEKELQEIVDFDILTVLKNAGPSFNDIFDKCVIKDNEKSNCPGSFREVFTADGMCYTFNGLMPNHLYRNNTCARFWLGSLHRCFNGFDYTGCRIFSTQTMDAYRSRMQLNWTLEYGYHPGDWYPYRTRGGIYGENVRVLMYVSENDMDNYCNWDSGFKVGKCFEQCYSNLFACLVRCS